MVYTNNMNAPLISVIMPVYNAEKYLAKAIESILSQTLSNFEFIIINDASSDSSHSIISDYAKKDKRIKLINNEKNLHIGGSLNKGISTASSNYIARMDGDDISLPERLEHQYNKLKSNNNIAVVGGNIITINQDGDKLDIRKYPTESTELKNVIFRYLPFAHPATMFRKDYFDEVGGYDPSKSPSEDMDLWIKLGAKYDFANIPEVVLKYRVFEDSFSNKKLRNVELNTIKMRWGAFITYGYRPSVFDILYNIGQLVTIWFMPASFRIKLFNLLRNKNII